MKQYCLALDLRDDPQAIRDYEEWHKQVWPEVLESIRQSGILKMEIFLTGNRLFMIMATADSFDFETKAVADLANPMVQEWEKLMWTFQQSLPWARPGEKWVLMNRIFSWTAENGSG
jgi:L-rhamnose mutarotase